jgi:putative ABC transport system permease protein
MLSLYLTLSRRYLQERWFRAVLVVASIALGVTTLVATRALNQSLLTATRIASTPLAGAADLHVSNGQFGLPRTLAEPLARVPGVRAVKPRLFEQAYLPDANRTVRLIGIDLRSEIGAVSSDIQIHPPAYVPDLSSGDTPVAVGTQLLADLHEPKTIHVTMPGDRRFTLTVLGSVSADGPAGALVDNALFMELSQASKLLEPGRANYVSRFDLFLYPDTDRDEVVRRVQAVLGKAAVVPSLAASTVGLGPSPLSAAVALAPERASEGEVITPEARGQDIHEVMAGLELGFALCGLGALLVGLFLVYNALSVTVAERRHDIGVLRSLGATRGQIAGLFVGESALLGVIGSVLGIPAGYGLAKLALGPMRDLLSDMFLPLEVTSLDLSPLMLLLAASAGVVTAVLAGLVPAMQAAAQEPADAVRRVPHTPGWRQRWLHIAVVIGIVAAGFASFALRRHLPARLGTFGGPVLMLLAAMLAMPLLAGALAWLLRPVTRRLFRIEERLAADNLVRAPGRTGLVIAALAAGVALMVETAGLIRSNEVPVLRWIDDTITADLFISRGGPVSASGQSQPMEVSMGHRLERAFPREVESALPVRFQAVKYR